MPVSDSNRTTRYSRLPSSAKRNGTAQDSGTRAPPAGNETPFPPCSKQMQGERDCMDRSHGITGLLLRDQFESQSSLSLQSIVDPPVLERLVASSWGGRGSPGAVVTTWAEITKQNALSGPSVYHEHYSSEEEDLAEELGKVSSATRATSPLGMDWNASSTKHSSFDTRKLTAYTKEDITSFSTFQTSDIDAAAYHRFATSKPPSPRSNRVGGNRLFATVKDATPTHIDESLLESFEEMALEDDDLEDEMELVQANTKNEFGIKDDCRNFLTITPSPDVLRMQRSPFKTPARESDLMDLSPPTINVHAFRTVFLPSPNSPRGMHQHRDIPVQVPARVKRTTSTFSYPSPIFMSDELGTTRLAETAIQPALESKAQSASQFLPRMPRVENHRDAQAEGDRNHYKESFTLRPRSGNFKIRASKDKGSAVEYTLNLSRAQATMPSFTPSLTNDAGPEPYQELYRATSPIMDHPLYVRISPRRQSSTDAPRTGSEHPHSHFPSSASEPSMRAKSKSHKSALAKKF